MMLGPRFLEITGSLFDIVWQSPSYGTNKIWDQGGSLGFRQLNSQRSWWLLIPTLDKHPESWKKAPHRSVDFRGIETAAGIQLYFSNSHLWSLVPDFICSIGQRSGRLLYLWAIEQNRNGVKIDRVNPENTQSSLSACLQNQHIPRKTGSNPVFGIETYWCCFRILGGNSHG